MTSSLTPSCFISYSWDDNAHKDWVRRLATDLQSNSVVARLDQWDTHPGSDLTSYMETAIRSSEYVVLVCTPLFAKKANVGQGGVGYEKTIVTGEIFQGIASPKKFVPILRRGGPKESLPSYLKSKYFIDFRIDQGYPQSLEDILRHIFDSPKFIRPPLGAKPVFTATKAHSNQAPTSPVPVFSLDAFKQLFEFAYNENGLNLGYRSKAEEWAKAWMNRYDLDDFELFKELFEFAYADDGLNLGYRSKAEEWARTWLEKHRDIDLAEFKRVFAFAYGESGLNLGYRSKAAEWAFKQLSKL